MPRGKNYVNNNRGVFLKASAKKGSKMESCYYGANCTRKDCFYRHDGPSSSGQKPKPQKSTEPCMAFLAGICSFSREACRKRHPSSEEECTTLIAQYQRIPCRYGPHCKTSGCLFNHPPPLSDSFPPLSTKTLPVAPVASAWRVAPPTSMIGKSSHCQVPADDSQTAPNLNANAKTFVPGCGWS